MTGNASGAHDRIFPSLSEAPQLNDVFRRFPHMAPPLLALHDNIMRDRSPLTVAERELIAAFVSGVNACTYCHGSHVIAAAAFGVDEALFAGMLADLGSSAVDARLKPLLRYVEKLTRTPSRMTSQDARDVYGAGWSEQALFDAIGVCALFNFMNRIVEGCGVTVDPLGMSSDDIAARRQRLAAPGADPHQAPRSYSMLLSRWGITSDAESVDSPAR